MHEALRAVPCPAPSWSRARDWVEYPGGVRESLEALSDERSRRERDTNLAKFRRTFGKSRRIDGAREMLAAVSEIVDELNAVPPRKDGQPTSAVLTRAQMLEAAFERAVAELLGFTYVFLGIKPGGGRRVFVGALVDAERRYAIDVQAPRHCLLGRRNNLVLTVDMLARRDELGPEHGLQVAPGSFMFIG